MACTDKAIRFCTPTLRINFATCAFTVRSSIPSEAPISLLDRPATSISSTSFSRSVNVTRPAGKIRPGADDTAIERAAVAEGMRPIFDSGLLAVLEGDTTIEEVVRCIRSEA